MDKRWGFVGCALLCGLMVGSGVVLILFFSYSVAHRYRVSTERYQEVIKEAQSRTNGTGDTVYFKSSWEHDVAPMPGLPRTNVCARKRDDGTLFVRIVEEDRHRAGKFGYIYDERENTSQPQLSSDLDHYGCGEWETFERLDGVWWRIESHLG